MGGIEIIKPLEEQQAIEVTPTGISALDNGVFGIGGLPQGRVIHVYAKTSVGKSTLVQWFCGVFHRAGINSVWADAERTIQKKYAAGSGMDLSMNYMIDWSTGPDLLFKMQQAIALNGFGVGVIDSLDAVRPLRDANKEVTANDRFQHPKMINDFFYAIQGGYEITGADGELIKNPYKVPYYTEKGELKYSDTIHKLSDKNMCLIIISHQKVSIGFGGFGPKTRTSGGDEKDFASSIKLGLKHKGFKKGKLRGETVLKFREVIVTADKNKLAPPLREATLRVMPDGNVIPDKEIITDVTEMGLDEAIEAGLANETVKEDEELNASPGIDDSMSRLRAMRGKLSETE